MSDPAPTLPWMSDLPADALGYQVVVAEFFLDLKGSGLLLSPLDQELVAEWERRGVPVPVVCRGIRRGLAELAAERPGPVRSLRAVRFAVEDEWRAYRSDRVGDSPAPAADEGEVSRRRLVEARGRLAVAAAVDGQHELLRQAFRDVERTLLAAGGGAGPPAERIEAALTAADQRLLAAWLASLPRPERAALGSRARLLSGPRRAGESRRAYRNCLRAHLFVLAGQAGLIRLGGCA